MIIERTSSTRAPFRNEGLAGGPNRRVRRGQWTSGAVLVSQRRVTHVRKITEDRWISEGLEKQEVGVHYEIGDITRGRCIPGDLMGTAVEGGGEA